MTHIFSWRNGPWPDNPKRASLFGRLCRIIASGRMRSALVEFENGQREIIDRYALRRLPPFPEGPIIGEKANQMRRAMQARGLPTE